MEYELPLTGAPQGQHNWWTKGRGGSRRTLRNWTGDWTTAKSVAQEGRKVKPVPPPTASHFTDRKTSITDLTSLKPAEDFPTTPPFFTLFLPFLSSFLFFYSFFLTSFICFIILIFVKIPSSFPSFDLFYSFFLPPFLSISIPFSFLPFFFFFSSFIFSQVRQ